MDLDEIIIFKMFCWDSMDRLVEVLGGNGILKYLVGTSEDAAQLDRLAAEAGIDPLILMDNAALAVFRVLRSNFDLDRERVLILAGTGNNGGDALGTGLKLFVEGYDVKICIVGDPGRYGYPAERYYRVLVSLDAEVTPILGRPDLPRLREYLEWSTVIVDGIFGTGLNREVEGFYREVIKMVNASKKPVVSVDIPSGVGGGDAKIYGEAVRASYTVALGILKIGNIIYPGAEYNGRLYITRLAYPSSLLRQLETRTYLNIPIEIKPRKESGHKGEFGKLLTVGGAANYYGAPLLSTYAFLKAGGGYARLASLPEVIRVAASRAPEIVYHPLEDDGRGGLSTANIDHILEIIRDAGIDILILGPGLGRSGESQELARELFKKVDIPVILDGDGLYILREEPEIVKNRGGETVLTPHRAEFSKIFRVSMEMLEGSAVEMVREIAQENRCYIVYKGAHTQIATPDGEVFINMSGNPGMATAGSGDVLNGVIAAMYGLGLRMRDAVKNGVFIHGLAGDLAAEELGMDGMTSWDILEKLPKAVKMLRESREEVVERYLPEVVL